MTEHRTSIAPMRWLVLVLSGILIGGGAILPGISGGVLCVIFGIYQPMMELLSHPVRAVPKYWQLFLPVILGWVIGFLGFARIIEWIFGTNETLGIWLFIGLITGTLPQLFAEAGEQGRTKSCWVSTVVSFVVLFSFLMFIRIGTIPQVVPSNGWFIFCGLLWGLSLVVPGMSSSAILIPLGLFEPLNSAIANFDMLVIGLWLLGLIATVILLARLVSNLFEKHYGIMYHAVLGITIASTLIIVPTTYSNMKTVALSAVCFLFGVAVAYFLSKLDKPAETE